MNPVDPIQLAPNLTIDAGVSPIVVVGANGTGKSMLGVQLAERGAKRISARRALEIPQMIALQPSAQAAKQSEEQSRQFATNRTVAASDLQLILTSLQAQEMELGRQVREQLVGDLGFQPSKADREALVSGLDHVRRIWEALFPGRKLSFEASEPKVHAIHRGGASGPFAQDQMSDGERQALYLAAKIASIPDGSVIIVDEPETHLHPTLARRLWDLLQEFRPGSRFLYITHDILFAVSRRAETIVACRADGNHELVSTIPGDVTADILGAASMTLVAGHIYFCEGNSDSLDVGLFDSWFGQSDVALYPVGSCDDVVRSVEGLCALPVHSAKVFGVVDRDARSQGEINHLSGMGICVLPVAEIEHLYCVPEVFRAVLEHLGTKASGDQDVALEEFRNQLAKSHVSGRHRLILERAKERVRWELKFPLSKVPTGGSDKEAAANLVAAYSGAVTSIDPGTFFAEAEGLVDRALAGSLEDLLRDIPGKGALAIAARVAGVSSERYVSLVRAGIRGELGPQVRTAIEAALTPLLPAR